MTTLSFRLTFFILIILLCKPALAATIIELANPVTTKFVQQSENSQTIADTGIYPVIDSTGKALPLALEERQKYKTSRRPRHLGIDLVVPWSYKFNKDQKKETFFAVAMFDGKIINSGRNGYGDGGRGNWAQLQVITANGNLVLDYEHLKTPVELSKFPSGNVKKGDIIGELGGTAYGRNYLPTQLHIGVIANGRHINPLPLLTSAFQSIYTTVANLD